MEFCVERIPGIKFFNVLPEEVDTYLRNRFDIATTIKGTLQLHRFVPLSQSHLALYKLSRQVGPPDVVAVTVQTEHDRISRSAD